MLLKSQVGFDLGSSVSEDKRVKPECPLWLHLADLFISPLDYIIFRMCSVSLWPGFFTLYYKWLTYNLSLRRNQHLSSQQSYYKQLKCTSNPIIKHICHHYFGRKSLHWSDLIFQQLMGQGLLYKWLLQYGKDQAGSQTPKTACPVLIYVLVLLVGHYFCFLSLHRSFWQKWRRIFSIGKKHNVFSKITEKYQLK